MRREGSCPCGAVRYSIDGPVRDVLVCHCNACREATGAPWAASAARRQDLTVDDGSALIWERARVSAHGASRGRCRTCGSVVFWDAPGLETVSFAVATLAEQRALEVAAHIWVAAPDGAPPAPDDVPAYDRGLPPTVEVPWRA